MRKCDDEFKQNAVRKILDGQSVASVARELGVGDNLLHKWKKVRIETSSETEKEVLELKKKLREVEMERAILKKCMALPPESTVERNILASGGTDAANVSGFCFVKALPSSLDGISALRTLISGTRF